MRNLVRILVLGVSGTLLACSDPPRVLQGKVLSYDQGKGVLILEDEAAPHLQRSVDTASAEFGAPTAPGNVVRVAYHDKEGRMVAGRVMNLSAQKASKKK